MIQFLSLILWYSFLCIFFRYSFLCIFFGYSFLCIFFGYSFLCIFFRYRFLCIFFGNSFLCILISFYAYSLDNFSLHILWIQFIYSVHILYLSDLYWHSSQKKWLHVLVRIRLISVLLRYHYAIDLEWYCVESRTEYHNSVDTFHKELLIVLHCHGLVCVSCGIELACSWIYIYIFR